MLLVPLDTERKFYVHKSFCHILLFCVYAAFYISGIGYNFLDQVFSLTHKWCKIYERVWPFWDIIH